MSTSVPRIILRGENPFLISMFILAKGMLALNKNSLGKTIGFTGAIAMTGVLIALTGWRSIYFALVPSIILLLVIAGIQKKLSSKYF